MKRATAKKQLPTVLNRYRRRQEALGKLRRENPRSLKLPEIRDQLAKAYQTLAIAKAQTFRTEMVAGLDAPQPA